MKLLIFTFLLFLLTVVDANAAGNLKLTGEVTRLHIIHENAQSVELELDLILTLKNVSETPLILVGSKFDYVNLLLSRRGSSFQGDLFRLGGLKSTLDPNEASLVRKSLDRDAPPADLTRILGNNESLEFKVRPAFVIFKDKLPFTGNESWKTILSSSPVRMLITLEMFPGYLDRKMDKPQSFGRLLESRWRSFGLLQIEDLVSEPIEVDLCAAVKRG